MVATAHGAALPLAAAPLQSLVEHIGQELRLSVRRGLSSVLALLICHGLKPWRNEAPRAALTQTATDGRCVLTKQQLIDRRKFLAATSGLAALALPELSRAQTGLRPGEYKWMPAGSPSGPVVVIVSIPEQLTFVYRNGLRIGVSTCSTGKPGHRTPTGVFTILQKRVEHYSSIYNNAPMPYMQRLTWRGIALHAGDLPGYPASAGCVRLPMEFASKLFDATTMGTPVIVADRRNAPATVSSPGILLPEAARDQAHAAVNGQTARKSSWNATVVPVVRSIVVSGADRKAIVLVNGNIESEGAIRIRNEARPLGTQAFALLGPTSDRRALRWMSYGVGGSVNEGDVVDRFSNDALSRIEMIDAEASRQVAMSYRPGTTLVVTDL